MWKRLSIALVVWTLQMWREDIFREKECVCLCVDDFNGGYSWSLEF